MSITVRKTVQKLIAPGVLALSLAALALTSEHAVASASYASSEKGKAFIDEMVNEHDFSRAQLKQWLGSTRRYEAVLQAMAKPAEKTLTWAQYKPIFVKEGRIASALEFAREHASLLAQLEREYGVPTEIIVAIIGVESWFGKHKGKHPALRSLATLAFDYPPRTSFFRRELREFLLLSREEGLDPLTVKGSYAAAMGMPQFISSSYRAYAVDGDGDGKRDLFHSVPDISASVANYFKRHGWRNGAPVAEQVKPTAPVAGLIAKGVKPALSAKEFQAVGVPLKMATDERAALIELEGNQGLEYWVGHKNFYVITRYNHSPLYAMAVFQLAQSIKEGLASTQ